MGVEPKIGGFYPPKWMVKIMVPNPMNKWMIWEVKTPIFGSTPIFFEYPWQIYIGHGPYTWNIR